MTARDWTPHLIVAVVLLIAIAVAVAASAHLLPALLGQAAGGFAAFALPAYALYLRRLAVSGRLAPLSAAVPPTRRRGYLGVTVALWGLLVALVLLRYLPAPNGWPSWLWRQ